MLSVEVPLWKVEGTFRVHKPPVLLGYTYDSRSVQAEGMMEAAAQNHAENTYLTLFVTIEPQLSVPEPFHEKVCKLSACCLLSLSFLYLSHVHASWCLTFTCVLCIAFCGHACFVTDQCSNSSCRHRVEFHYLVSLMIIICLVTAVDRLLRYLKHSVVYDPSCLRKISSFFISHPVLMFVHCQFWYHHVAL